MSSIGDSQQDASRRNIKNMREVWRNTFRALKTTRKSSSGSGDDGSRLVSYKKSLSIDHVSNIVNS